MHFQNMRKIIIYQIFYHIFPDLKNYVYTCTTCHVLEKKNREMLEVNFI